jgi:hypothetical protein
MVVSLILPLWALYLLISDLIKFYFTGHHFGHEGGVTYPRFILSGILVDDKSLLEPGDMISARLQSSVTELLIPRSERARNRLLQEAHAIGECRGVGFYHKGPRKEQALRKFILTYTASLPRTLAQESAKMEASMARHVLRLRVLVMRYAKAFLLTILTTGTTITALVIMDFARPSVHDNLGYGKNEQLISGALTWVGFLAVYAAWGFLAAWLVRRPVAWIYEDLADENALRKTPESIYQFERLTLLLVAASTGTVSVSLWLHALEIRDGNIMWLTGVLTMLLIIPAFVYVGQALMKGRKARSGRHIP